MKKLLPIACILFYGASIAQTPTITSFSPASGAVGTLVTITGINLGNPTAFTIGGANAIVVSNTGAELVGMVMPGAITGTVSITTGGGSVSSAGNFTVTSTPFPGTQQGAKLIGTGAVGGANQGRAVAVSADGNTAISGGLFDNSNKGAAWIYVRSAGTWVQQGNKLVGTGTAVAQQGISVAISADGNTAIVGGNGDNSNIGAAWVYVRSGSTWSQQQKLIGTGVSGTIINQGISVALSADGNTAVVGGSGDNTNVGAVWVFTRSGAVWTQQGSKLLGAGGSAAHFGNAVAISADGNTLLVGGNTDNSNAGAAWIFLRTGNTWTSQASKLVGNGASGAASQGRQVSLSADGNTAIVGGPLDDGNAGAAWIYTRSGGSWSQQGAKLVGTGGGTQAQQGRSVSLSADGNTALMSGFGDNGDVGAVWVFTRSAGTWIQQGNKLVGNGAIGPAKQGIEVALSADGSTALIGGLEDNTNKGATWVYVVAPAPTITSFTPAEGPVGTLVTITGTGLENLTSFTIGGTNAIVVSADGNELVGMVMPGATTGGITLITPTGNASGSGNFTVIPTPFPGIQQGSKLVNTNVTDGFQGQSTAISADGNTAVVGAYRESGGGAIRIYTRVGSIWSQQGSRLVGTGGVNYSQNTFPDQGWSVAISADGNTVIEGAHSDSDGNGNLTGAAWVFTRTNGVWTQQGKKLVGAGSIGHSYQGSSVSISANGNTAIVGGQGDNSNKGAAWVYKRSGGVWTQEGSKLVGSGSIGSVNINQGVSVSISADGNTAIIGGQGDNSYTGAAWIFIRTNNKWIQQGSKIVGTGSIGASSQGFSVSLSSDGSTALVGGSGDNSGTGAVWAFIRSGGIWSQQGSKLVGLGSSGNTIYQGQSVSLSADGNTAIIGGSYDNGGSGAAWVFTRSSSEWTQRGNKLVGAGKAGSPHIGISLALSSDGTTAIAGGPYDNSYMGASWIFTVAPPPTISSISPASGPVGTLVTITGTNLDNPTNFTIGGVAAIVVSNIGTELVGMVMPGTVTGSVSITTSGGTISSGGNFTVTPTPFPGMQQGAKLVGTGAVGGASQGRSVAVSADGNTAIVGGLFDNSNKGAAWIYTRSGETWTQQGNKLVGSGSVGQPQQGISVAISADGNTAVVGGNGDNTAIGAAWVFVRNGSTWAQQGPQLIGSGAVGASEQGKSVAISADGKTIAVGGNVDNSNTGALWVYTRTGTSWVQQGNKIVGTGATGSANRGISVALSSDGNTLIFGGHTDNSNVGAAWVFTRANDKWTQQGTKLVGSGFSGASNQGRSVALSADGNTAMVGGSGDNNGAGATWVYARSGGVWTQQTSKLVGTGAGGAAAQGRAVSLSADGNTAIVTGLSDNGNAGALWVFKRNGVNWMQQGNKLVGTGGIGPAQQGINAALSADGTTAMVGGLYDNTDKGAAWVFVLAPPPAITSFTPSSGPVGTLVAISGTNLNNPTGFTIGGVDAIVVSNTGTELVGMVMPGASTGALSVTTPTGSSVSAGSFSVLPSNFPGIQQGNNLVGTGAVGLAYQGYAVSVSADANTAIVGGPTDNSSKGTAWIYTRAGGLWTQQGNKLVGSGAVNSASQGISVSISADGNTVIIGGYADNTFVGAAWIFVRAGGVWAQQGGKLVGTGATGASSSQGTSVSLSADGNTAIVGGQTDNGSIGAAWIYTRAGGVWAQQGGKLVGTGATGNSNQGRAVSLSSDGNTAIVGGEVDNSSIGAAWVYTRSDGIWTQQGSKLAGTDAVGAAHQGRSVALSANGNTAIVGGYADDNLNGAAWIYTRTGGVWAQQGAKLVGTGAIGTARQGNSVSLSADGNIAIVGGFTDNSNVGATWVYSQSGGVWTQRGNKLLGTGVSGGASQANSVSLSSDGNTVMVGGPFDNSNVGAAWAFVPCVGTPSAISGSPVICSGTTHTYNIGLVSDATSYAWTLPSGWTGTSTSNSIDATASATSGDITVVANNSCGSSPTQTLTISVEGGLPAQPGAITGLSTVCSETMNTYSIAVVSGANSYTWTLPSGWTGTSTTNSINTTASSTGGNISVTANNGCGTSPVQMKTIAVNIKPDQPDIITGANTVCTGTIHAYSIPAVAGATSYTWTLPSGWAGTSTTNSIDATASSNGGTMSVKAENASCSSDARTLAVTVNSQPVQPLTIDGDIVICGGTVNTYSTEALSGTTSYTWVLPGGWEGTSTTNSIDVTPDADGGVIQVTANNSCGSSTAQTLNVTVNNPPAQPAAINGTATICSGSVNAYSVVSVAGATSYTWTLPGGWTGTSTTNSIEATSGSSGGDISVTADNACGSSVEQLVTITVDDGVPAQPGSITGNSTICAGTLNTYSIVDVNGATNYTWTLPADWTGTSTTNSIDVTTSSTSGDISVTANNSCGSSTAQTLTVSIKGVPAQPGTISGATTICSPSVNNYTVVSVNEATSYTWTLPPGWTGTSSTNSIDATSNAAGGVISVTAINACGASIEQTLSITFTTLSKPSITVNISNPASPILTSNSDAGNQWFLDGTAISGATNNTYIVNAKGSYKVQVISGSCVSELSEAAVFVVTGDVGAELNENHSTVYPNPVENILTVKLNGFNPGELVKVRLTDNIGRSLMEVTERGEGEVIFEMGNFSGGVYFVHASQGSKTQLLRLVKK